MWTVYVCRSRSTQMPVRVKDFYEESNPSFVVQQFDAATLMPIPLIRIEYSSPESKESARMLIFADLDIEEEFKDS